MWTKSNAERWFFDIWIWKVFHHHMITGEVRLQDGSELLGGLQCHLKGGTGIHDSFWLEKFSYMFIVRVVSVCVYCLLDFCRFNTNHQVVPSCTPKKAKCKGVTISFVTSTGCTVSMTRITIQLWTCHPSLITCSIQHIVSHLNLMRNLMILLT